jgi:hypothetical protein
MSKKKKTPKESMKYWNVNELKIRARTARVAVRKYLRGSLDNFIVLRECMWCGQMPSEVLSNKDSRDWVRSHKHNYNINVKPWND